MLFAHSVILCYNVYIEETHTQREIDMSEFMKRATTDEFGNSVFTGKPTTTEKENCPRCERETTDEFGNSVFTGKPTTTAVCAGSRWNK